MKAIYNRISTKEQNILNQTDKATSEQRVYFNICSGTIPFEKREYVKDKKIKNAFGGSKELLSDIENGIIKELQVYAVDRLGRNLINVLQTIEVLTNNNVNLFVESLGMYSLLPNGEQNPAFKIIVSLMANISEMERNTMLERQKIGIAKAKANGKYIGRIAGAIKTDENFLLEYKHVVKEINLNSNLSLRKLAKITGVSVTTVQKVKRLHTSS
ncbi:recombinase family protein [Tenacibaculum dicentrarchi]|uniref:recombinase family protein n=1 Tax=Tenacibaculum dicentrarchi TaxID=669041 RepID=UPI00351530D2